MAGREMLNSLEKRDLLNQPAVSVETLVKWGEHYEEMGSVHDALDFYVKANAREAMSRLKKTAADEGDFFLCKRICLAMAYEPGAEEWLALARKAEALGKHLFAAEAYRRAGIEQPVQPAALAVTSAST